MAYAHPEVLVDTQWVADNLKDSEKVRIAEVDYDPRSNYSLGHIPGAVLFDLLFIGSHTSTSKCFE